MMYHETLEWMFKQLPMYQRLGKTAFKKDLTNITAFTKHLNNPHKNFKSIHVAGTNGKGSTCHMIASILQEAGYKVGLYTSPHLKNFTERIRINGEEIPRENVVDFIANNKDFLERQKLSFFEMTVGMAFDYFSKEQVDVAIIEVGLGGRLDSTNIITPLVSVITNIGLDHTQFLGETLPEIATEKAGIIKENIPVVIGEEQDEVLSVFQQIAKERKAQIFLATKRNLDYKTDLKGSYQKKNVKTAVSTIDALKEIFKVSDSDLNKGLLNVVKNTSLKGRWQVLQTSPKVICDTAHNKEGLSLVMEQLKNESYTKLHVVLGVVNDKSLSDILSFFPLNAHYYFCKPNIPRGLDVKILKSQASDFNLEGDVYSSVKESFNAALKNASKDDLIYVGGSTFVVAEII